MGKPWTKERKEKFRGKGNPMYGKHHTTESIKKMKKSHIGLQDGENNPFYGKTHTEKSKKKMSEWHKGKPSPMKGKNLSKETKGKLSEAHKGTHHTLETIKKMSGKNHPLYSKHRSEETRKKIGDGNRGKYVSLESRRKNSEAHIGLQDGENNPFYGKHHTKESREKISKSNKGKLVGDKNPNYGKFGENHPSWLDGKSFEPYTFDFNKRFKGSIKERDFHCCQLCNIGEEDLLLLKRRINIHHIDYNKKLSIPQNCITLCNKCNGIVNFNRKHWTAFFQSLLKEKYNYEYTQDQKVILNYT